jgi:putative ABC transport system permease protein
VLIAAFGRPGKRPPTEEQEALLHQKIVQQLESLPGIASVASSGMLPGYNGGRGSQVTAPGTGHEEEAGVSDGSENLLQTLEFRLIRGRWFSKAEVDSTRYVAVINQTMARDFFGDADPMGQQLEVKSFAARSEPPHDAYFQIVGVVADVKNYGPTQPASPQAFIPYTIRERAILILKTRSDPTSLMHPIQEQIWAIDRGIVFGEFTPITEMLNRFTYSAPKLVVAAVTPLAAIGLLLVIIGIFSVMAYTVSLQTHEIGIRLALGAQQGDILKMVLRKGLVLIAAGIVIGVGVSLGLARFIASQLWGVSPTDPWTFAAVVVAILVVGLAACFFPARRATQVDPVVTLRYE